MKKRRVYYDVTNLSGYYWQRGKWMIDLDDRYGASSHAQADTFRKALRIANKCPAEMIITKWYIKHGERWCREMILKAYFQ